MEQVAGKSNLCYCDQHQRGKKEIPWIWKGVVHAVTKKNTTIHMSGMTYTYSVGHSKRKSLWQELLDSRQQNLLSNSWSSLLKNLKSPPLEVS